MSCLVYGGENVFAWSLLLIFVFLNAPEDDLELRLVQLVTVGVCFLVFGLHIPVHWNKRSVEDAEIIVIVYMNGRNLIKVGKKYTPLLVSEWFSKYSLTFI